MTEYRIRPLLPSDGEPVLEIFNYYVEHGFAAYPESKVPPVFFDRMMAACTGYPRLAITDDSGNVAGFGMLHAHNPMPSFSRTAEITYFLRPGRTGRELGSRLLEALISEGQKRGIATVLASISSRNEGSIRFHARHGFTECGRFRDVGKKQGTLFDTVWMQKMI